MIKSNPKRSQGFTLLEALIAVVLLAFAFLSTAGLHLNTLRDSTQSAQMIVAAQLADEMVSRLRVSSQGQVLSLLEANGASTANCFNSSACSSAEMAQDEVAKWRASINDRLAGGANPALAGGTICRDTGPGDGNMVANSCTGGATDPIVVKVWWPARRANKEDPTNASVGAYQQVFAPYVSKLY